MPRSVHMLWLSALAGMLILCAGVTVLSIRSGKSPALIASDGKAYYAWARSVVLDRDVDFDNDYRLIYPPDPLPPEIHRRTPTGKVLNKTPVGLALLEAPGVALGTLLTKGFPEFPADGVSLPYQLAVCGGLALYALLGWALLLPAMIRWKIGVGPAVLFWLGMMGATNLIHYLAKEPSMAHAAGMCTACMLVWLISRRPPPPAPLSVRFRLALGAGMGLLFLIRNANLVLLPFLFALFANRRKIRGADFLWIALGAMAVASIQPLATWALWGTPAYRQYPGETFSGGWQGLSGVLFSARHGLFIYHPWYALLAVLLIPGLRIRNEDRMLFVTAAFAFIAAIAGNGLWWCWWLGDGFGHRGFVETLVPLTFCAARVSGGLRAGFRRIALPVLLCVCCAGNVWLWGGYLLQRYAHDGSDPLSAVYGWPWSDGSVTLPWNSETPNNAGQKN